MISCGWVNYGFFIFILYEWVCGYFEYNLSISEWFSVWFGLMRRSSFVLVSSIATLIFGGLYVVRFLKNIDIFEHMILSHFNNDDFSKIRGFYTRNGFAFVFLPFLTVYYFLGLFDFYLSDDASVGGNVSNVNGFVFYAIMFFIIYYVFFLLPMQFLISRRVFRQISTCDAQQ